jgi:NADH:ubiquinone oxidoreductase subunit 4 (subunit M)
MTLVPDSNVTLWSARSVVGTSPRSRSDRRVPATADSRAFTDLRTREVLPVATLLALSLLIGLVPGPLLEVVEPAAATVVDLVAR